jgi:hypothetical protein
MLTKFFCGNTQRRSKRAYNYETNKDIRYDMKWIMTGSSGRVLYGEEISSVYVTMKNLLIGRIIISRSTGCFYLYK